MHNRTSRVDWNQLAHIKKDGWNDRELNGKDIKRIKHDHEQVCFPYYRNELKRYSMIQWDLNENARVFTYIELDSNWH